MFVYIARRVFGVGDVIILGVAKTIERAKEICENDAKESQRINPNEEWEDKPGTYLTLYTDQRDYYTISDWVLE